VRVRAAAVAALAAFAIGVPSASAQPVSCGQVITQNTTLDADLYCDVPGQPTVRIGADGITLDLGGHTLGANHTAIVNDGHDRVTIRNGTVLADDGAVVLNGADHNRLHDLTLRGLYQGFVLTDSDHNTISSNTLPGIGILVLGGSDDNTIAGNTITSGEGFIWLTDANRNRIVRNVVDGTDGPAIQLTTSHRNRIAGNHVAVNFWRGMYLDRSDRNELVENLNSTGGPYGPPGGGFELHDSNRNLLARNVFDRTRLGALVASGADNVLTGNEATQAQGGPFPVLDGDGFRVDAPATGTQLTRNVAIGFSDDGIDVDAAGTLLRRNTANDNGDLGIEAVPGIIDLGGNRASGNGNPLQCLNVVCR
jgi:large repetitive protein